VTVSNEWAERFNFHLYEYVSRVHRKWADTPEDNMSLQKVC